MATPTSTQCSSPNQATTAVDPLAKDSQVAVSSDSEDSTRLPNSVPASTPQSGSNLPFSTTWHLPLLKLAQVALLIITALIIVENGRPLISRASSLWAHLSAHSSSIAEDSQKRLADDVLSQLFAKLPGFRRDRLLIHDLGMSSPEMLGDAGTRVASLRRLADAVPELTPIWLPYRAEVRTEYHALLTDIAAFEKTRGSLTPEADDRLQTLAHKQPHSTRRATRPPKGQPDDSLRSFGARAMSLAIGVLLPEVVPKTLLSQALEDLAYSYTIDPSDAAPQYPRAGLRLDELTAWLATPPMPLARTRVVIGEARTVANSGKDLKPGPNTEPMGDLAPAGRITLNLAARDWRVLRIERPWLNEGLLEKVRKDWHPFLSLEDFFGRDGSLTAVPMAFIIAKDIAHELRFESRQDFERARQHLIQGSAVRVSLEGVQLLIPGESHWNDADLSLLFTPPTASPRVVAVVSVLY